MKWYDIVYYYMIAPTLGRAWLGCVVRSGCEALTALRFMQMIDFWYVWSHVTCGSKLINQSYSGLGLVFFLFMPIYLFALFFSFWVCVTGRFSLNVLQYGLSLLFFLLSSFSSISYISLTFIHASDGKSFDFALHN